MPSCLSPREEVVRYCLTRLDPHEDDAVQPYAEVLRRLQNVLMIEFHQVRTGIPVEVLEREL